jgi:zona occludens toxin
MALTIYVGTPGSGKSYVAIHDLIIPAYQAGRHIVTNIKGVVPEYWADNLEPAKGCALGTIVKVDDDYFANELNYPLMSKNNVVDDAKTSATAIPAGAMIVVDEAYNQFPTGNETTKRMIEYVRTHRHFVDANGIASDIVLISQDTMGIHPRVRTVAEFVTSVRNMRYLPLMAKRYRIDVYASHKMTKSSALGSSIRKYKDDVFKFYKSFESEGAAKVVMTDKSHTAIKPKHYVFLALIVAGIAFLAFKMPATVRDLNAKNSSKELMAAPAASSRKPECIGSGLLVDLKDRRVFSNGDWRPVDATFVGADGRVRWDVGPCLIAFGARANSGRNAAQNSGGNSVS